MIHEFEGKKPKIEKSCFIAEGACVIGDVKIGEDSSVWFNAVVRADLNKIRIGKRVGVQDCCVLHVDEKNSLEIADDVVIGHGAVLHGCKIGKNCLIGMSTVILSGAEVGDNSVVAAGAVVTENMKIPAKSFVVGVPAKIAKEVSSEMIEKIRKNVREYVGLKRKYEKN